MKKFTISFLLLLVCTMATFAGTWQKLDLTKTGGGTINLNINKLEFFEGKLYAATFDGIWVSPSANGGDWEAYGLQGEKVSHLCFGAMKLANVIITATDDPAKTANKLYKYNGSAWVLTNLNPTGVKTFYAVHTSMAQIQDGGGNTVIVYPTWGNGIWRSTDGGDTWTNYAQEATVELDAKTGVPLNAYKNVVSVRSFPGTTTLYGTDKVSGGMSYMIWSTDYGVTWNNKAVGAFFNPYSILSRKMNGVDVLYYAGQEGNAGVAWRSEDFGANWTHSLTAGAEYWEIRKLIGDDDGKIYALSSVHDVYVSDAEKWNVEDPELPFYQFTFATLGTGITIPNPRVSPATGTYYLSDMVKSATKLYVSAIMTEGIYVYDFDSQLPTAPQNLQNTIPTATSFTLSWTAATDNVAVTGYEVYKDGALYGSTSSATTLSITGLTTVTAYRMTVKAKDADGNLSVASTALVVTTADNQAPNIPANLLNTVPTATAFTLNWTAAADNVATTGYNVYKNGALYGSTSAETTLSITDLTTATAYSMTVKAKDAAGNLSAASTALVVTTVDNQAPSIPANLLNTVPSPTSFTLSWTAATDNVAVTGYEIYKDGVLYGATTTATTLSISGLTTTTAYSMTVKAKDAAGNISAASSTLVVTTADNIAPTAPINLLNTTPTTNSFILNWSAATDNLAVTGYNVYKDGALYGTSSSASNAITGLLPGTSYNMTVKAVDAAGNISDASLPLSVCTRYSPVEIGMVGVNGDNKNRVAWNKPVTAGISSFYIYRETNVTNVYEKIGTVPYDSMSIFIDTQSLPDVQSSAYKISVYGISGLESAQSTYHKTMHLSINKGMGAAWNLNWESYEGIIVSTYNIYRGTSPTNLTLLGSTSGNSSQYNDLYAPAGNVYYQLEVISPNSVNPTKVIAGQQRVIGAENVVLQDYSSSRSNIATNSLSAIHQTDAVSFEVYPNPSNGQVTIETWHAASLLNNYRIVVVNSLGQQLYLAKVLTEKTHLDFSQFGKQGVYFVQIVDEKGNVVGRKKVVVE